MILPVVVIVAVFATSAALYEGSPVLSVAVLGLTIGVLSTVAFEDGAGPFFAVFLVCAVGLLLSAGSLGGEQGLGGNVWQWFVPAILVMTTLFGTATTGSNLLYEFQTGAHERMLVTPLSRPSLLVGRSLKEVLPLIGQALIVIVVMIPFGFRADVLGAVLGLGRLHQAGQVCLLYTSPSPRD